MWKIQNRHQKAFNRGVDTVKIDKTPLIYSVSYFNFGALGARLGSNPIKDPVATGLGK